MGTYGIVLRDTDNNIILDHDSQLLTSFYPDGSCADIAGNAQKVFAFPESEIVDIADDDDIFSKVPGYSFLSGGVLKYRIVSGATLVAGKPPQINFYLTDDLADGDTLTIGNKTYRFKDTVAQANDIKIHATSRYYTVVYLMKAINGDSTTGKHGGTVAHTQVRAFPTFARYQHFHIINLFAVSHTYEDGEIQVSWTGTNPFGPSYRNGSYLTGSSEPERNTWAIECPKDWMTKWPANWGILTYFTGRQTLLYNP